MFVIDRIIRRHVHQWIVFSFFFQKDAMVETLRGEKQQLTHDVEHLRQELQTVRTNHDTTLNEVRALKVQLNERILAATTSPSIVAAVSDRFVSAKDYSRVI